MHLIAGSGMVMVMVMVQWFQVVQVVGKGMAAIAQKSSKSANRIGVKLLIKNQDVSLLSCWGSLSSMIEWMGQNLSQHMKGR